MFLGFKLLKFWAFRLLDFWSLEMDFFGPLGFWAIREQLYETNTEIMVYIPTSIPCTPARYHPHALPAPTLSPPALFSSIRGIQSHTMTKVIVIIYI